MVNLQGVVFTSCRYTTLGRIELANPGIYFINLNIQIVVLPAYSGYNESSLQISTPSQSHQSDFLINNSTYGRRTMSIIEKVEEPSNVQFGVYIIAPTITENEEETLLTKLNDLYAKNSDNKKDSIKTLKFVSKFKDRCAIKEDFAKTAIKKLLDFLEEHFSN